jgi:hypothetical protein
MLISGVVTFMEAPGISGVAGFKAGATGSSDVFPVLESKGVAGSVGPLDPSVGGAVLISGVVTFIEAPGISRVVPLTAGGIPATEGTMSAEEVPVSFLPVNGVAGSARSVGGGVVVSGKVSDLLCKAGGTSLAGTES